MARIRPYEIYPAVQLLIDPPLDYSFPSGHTCSSFCSAFIYLKMLKRPYGISAVVMASLIALSRVYLGVHYPTDILGGLMVAAVVSGVLLVLLESGSSSSSGGSRRSNRYKGSWPYGEDNTSYPPRHRGRGRRK